MSWRTTGRKDNVAVQRGKTAPGDTPYLGSPESSESVTKGSGPWSEEGTPTPKGSINPDATAGPREQNSWGLPATGKKKKARGK